LIFTTLLRPSPSSTGYVVNVVTARAISITPMQVYVFFKGYECGFRPVLRFLSPFAQADVIIM